MKNIYLLLMVCAAAVSAQAANLKFFIGNQEVTPGSTVYFSDYQAEEYETGVWDIMMAPEIAVMSDFFTNTVTVTAECTSGQSIQMCAGGQCKKGTTVVKDNLTLRRDTKLDLEFEFMNGEYEGVAVPDVTTKFSAVDGNGTPVEFTLVMGPSAASVETVGADTYVTPVSGGIEYALTAPCGLTIYTLAGVPVMTAKLNGRGFFATAGLPAGLYVYSLGTLNGKIIVK